MLPVIPIVAAAVSAAILIRKEKHRYLHGRIHSDLSRFARDCGVNISDDGSFDPNTLVDGEPLLFSVLNMYYIASKLKYLEMLLAYGANPDICNSKGVPALIHALSCEGSYSIISMLLLYGANPNAMDADGRTAVFFADSPKILSILRDAGAELDAVDANGKPALFYWLSNVETQNCLAGLLACGVNPDICNSEGVPALIYALSIDNSSDLVYNLLACGANPNARDANGRTAVFFADLTFILSELRNAGAKFDVVDAMGKPAFFHILSVARALYFVNEAGVDVNTTDSEGKTIAFYISGPNDFILLQKLEAEGLDVNAKDNSGHFFDYHSEYYQFLRNSGQGISSYEYLISTQLNDAVRANDISGAIRALENGADPDTLDRAAHRWNMIHLAVYRNNPKMIEALARYGVDINYSRGVCPLETAIYTKNEACVEMLLSLGADPEPVMGALKRSANPVIQEILSKYGYTVK